MERSTPKAGVLDDPTWTKPLPQVVPHRRSSKRPISRRLVVGIAVAILVFASVLVFWVFRGGNPDPGSQILRQVASIRSAVPHGVVINYANLDEPRIDSCDGIPSTRGWSDVVAQINFNWSGSPSALVASVNQHLIDVGWVDFEAESNNGQPGGAWQKRLTNRTTARAQLSVEPLGSWTLFASAPPVGKRVSGC